MAHYQMLIALEHIKQNLYIKEFMYNSAEGKKKIRKKTILKAKCIPYFILS